MNERSSAAETLRFPVAGMTCGSCVNRITRAIRKLDGVTKVDVDLRRETATVRREPALVSNAALAAAVVDAGYTADLASAVTIPVTEGRRLVERLLGETELIDGADRIHARSGGPTSTSVSDSIPAS